MSGPLVRFCDGGVVMLMDGSVLPSTGLTLGSGGDWVEKSGPQTMWASLKVLHCANPLAFGLGYVTPMAACWA
eukprot:scaffold173138_cov63-Attheya_sp.AAC.2